MRKHQDRKEETQVMPCVLEHTRPMPDLGVSRKGQAGASKWKFFQPTKKATALLLIGGFIIAAILGYASAQYARDRLEIAAGDPARHVKYASDAPRTDLAGIKGDLDRYAEKVSEKMDTFSAMIERAQGSADEVKSSFRQIDEMQKGAAAFIARHETEYIAARQYIEEKQKKLSHFLSEQFGESGAQKK